MRCCPVRQRLTNSVTHQFSPRPPIKPPIQSLRGKIHLSMTLRYLPLFLVLFALLACGAGDPAPEDVAVDTVFFLTRHAEKGSGQDPELLPAGEARARRLAERLKSANVGAVYSTDFQRTKATAGPVAKVHGLPVTVYPADAGAGKLAQEWLRKHRGRTVVVVGHSNTIPRIVNALIGARRYGDLSDGDYSKLYRVSVDGQGKARVEVLSSDR